MVRQLIDRRVLLGFTLIVVLIFRRGACAGDPPIPESLAGRLLVAAPSMPDVRFAESVIYMVVHDHTGAVGVIVNRPMGEVTLADLLDSLDLQGDAAEGRIGVHYGGPVENDLGFVLHSGEGADLSDDRTLGISGGFTLSQDEAVVQAIVAGDGPRRSLLVFGYAGWGPGQLEKEMQNDDWLVVPADEDIVFGADHDTKWQRAMDRRGLDL
jgi:putative transcriptional regulator